MTTIEDGVLLPLQLEQQRGDVFGGGLIQVACRLVAQEQPGLTDQRAGNGDALTFAARERRRPVIDAVGEANALDERPRACDIVAMAARRSVGNEHVLEDRALRKQAVVLEDEPDLLVAERRQPRRVELKGIAAVERDGSGRRRLQPADDVEE